MYGIDRQGHYVIIEKLQNFLPGIGRT